MFILSEIPHGSTAYDDAVRLRRQVLRTPLGLDFTTQQLKAEASEQHFAAYHDGVLIGSISAQRLPGGIVKFRQMAVVASWQGRGIGTAMLAHAEAWAKLSGCFIAMLHARVSAQGFYEKSEYVAQGEVFTEVTVDHIKMTKVLG